jgi:hypothetical protein
MMQSFEPRQDSGVSSAFDYSAKPAPPLVTSAQSNFMQHNWHQPLPNQPQNDQLANHFNDSFQPTTVEASKSVLPPPRSDQYQNHQQPSVMNVQPNGGANFFESPGEQTAPPLHHQENVNFRADTQANQASAAPKPSTYYPENREHLDDLATPQSSSLSSFTDRHNYLVTGQLSQERPPLPYQQQAVVNSQTEPLPPPGLSRLVVGQPETSFDQAAGMSNDVPHGLNRMVTGTEMTSSSYINFQRQADGEVSQAPSVPQRPQSNSPFSHSHHIQNNHDTMQQSFNTSDRNLYLVAGESDVHDQRVIPGVESENSVGLSHPMQSLYIQAEVPAQMNVMNLPVQERNLNVDGMEIPVETHEHRQADVLHREEVIDGANDTTESFTVATHVASQDRPLSIEPESDMREEAIEGANDYNDDINKTIEELKQKIDMKKQEISSEDSDLLELARNKSKGARRSKKYTDDSIESEIESDGDRKERYYSRRPPNDSNREDKSRKSEKERRPRPKRGDDTDGSKYGDSRRRTDDEEDLKKSDKYRKSSRSKHQDDDVRDDRGRKKREKPRDSKRSE